MITRNDIPDDSRYWLVTNVLTPADIDDALRDLLTEAYSDGLP